MGEILIGPRSPGSGRSGIRNPASRERGDHREGWDSRARRDRRARQEPGDSRARRDRRARQEPGDRRVRRDRRARGDGQPAQPARATTLYRGAIHSLRRTCGWPQRVPAFPGRLGPWQGTSHD